MVLYSLPTPPTPHPSQQTSVSPGAREVGTVGADIVGTDHLEGGWSGRWGFMVYGVLCLQSFFWVVGLDSSAFKCKVLEM